MDGFGVIGNERKTIATTTVKTADAIPVAPGEREYPMVVEFLNRNLRPDSKWSIVDEYPTALSKSQMHNMRVIIEDGKIVSHAVFRPMIVKTPVGVFKVAGIGSVVTSPDHRGQGHSTQIIDSCLEAAAAADCDFAILWTDLFDFYRRMDFELAGSEVTVMLDRDLGPTAGWKFLESSKVAPETLLRVFQQHSVSSHRSQEDVRLSLAIPNSTVMTAWEPNGRLAAYAVVGKGADLAGYIHEWGGSVTALLGLFSHLRNTLKCDLRLIAPSHATGLLSKLSNAGCPEHRGYLGMVRLLKTESMFSKIKRHARTIGISDLVLEEIEPGKFKFGHLDQIYMSDSKRDLVQLLFGPEKPSQMGKFDPTTAKVLDRVLPIPLWIWGWDSV